MDKISPELNKNFSYKKAQKNPHRQREISKLIKYIEISYKRDLSTSLEMGYFFICLITTNLIITYLIFLKKLSISKIKK